MKITKISFKKSDDPIYKEGFKTFTPNKYNKKKVELKLPIELITSLRDKGAGAVALARTTNGGAVPVLWSSPTLRWQDASDLLTVADITGAPPLIDPLLEEEIEKAEDEYDKTLPSCKTKRFDE
jgi:hypothetical protein